MTTDKTSMDRLNQLHPSVRDSAIRAYTKACKITPVGIHPFITETDRSFKRSDELYAQGRTKPGQIVTNAKGGQSIHNYKLAIDFVILIDNKMSWKVDDNWLKVVACFKEEGWVWGGDWKSFKDYPHVEKTNGNSLKVLQAKYAAKDFIPGTTYVNI